MDPSIEICKVRNSFDKTEIKSDTLIPYSNQNMNYELEIIGREIENMYKDNVIYVNMKKYNELQTMKDNFNNPNFTEARNKANPYENIGRSIFMNRAAIKIANIDAVFNLTGQKGGYINKQQINEGEEFGNFLYCDIGSAPGGFTEYIQYRRPLSMGYGISLNKKYGGLGWRKDKINMERFRIEYGPDNSGDLYKHSDWFANLVTKLHNGGVNLVTADGGFSGDTSARKHEILTSRLILNETLVALKTLKKGGDYVCKMYDTVSKISADLIYLISMCFNEVNIFKPMSSRPANAERYLVAKGLKGNVSEFIRILQEANQHYTDTKYIYQLFKYLPNDYENWLTQHNNISLQLQTQTAINILSLLNSQDVNIPVINLYKCLAIWNLPDNKPNKSDKIKVYN